MNHLRRFVPLLVAAHCVLGIVAAAGAAGRSWPHVTEMALLALIGAQAGLLGVVGRVEGLSIARRALLLGAGVAWLLLLLGFNNVRDYGSLAAAHYEHLWIVFLFVVAAPMLVVWSVLTAGRVVIRREDPHSGGATRRDVQFSLKRLLALTAVTAALLGAARGVLPRIADPMLPLLVVCGYGLCASAITLAASWMSLSRDRSVVRMPAIVALVLLLAALPPAVLSIWRPAIVTGEGVAQWIFMLFLQTQPIIATLEIAGAWGCRLAARNRQPSPTAAVAQGKNWKTESA